MSRLKLACFLILGGCCGGGESLAWEAIPDQALDSGAVELVLDDFVVGGGGPLTFDLEADAAAVVAWVEGDVLSIAPQPGWEGETDLVLSAVDRCDNRAEVSLHVTVGEEEATTTESCPVTFDYVAQGLPDYVYLAGSFNDWSAQATPMAIRSGETWSVTVDLEPGAYAYKFMERNGKQAWACDPNAALIQCDEGYKAADDTSWTHDCSLGADSCNSMLVVPDCALPVLTLDVLSVDADEGQVTASVSFAAGLDEAEATEATVTLDGVAVDGWTGSGFELSLEGLSATRHTLRFDATDTKGRAAETLYVPFWLDGDDWKQGAMYYAFVDRFANGDTSLETSEGATAELGSYMGGDFQGVIDRLPYLDDLGVTVLWLTNPQDNASGAWEADCGTYAAYHGYWPVDRFGVEDHFGDTDSLQALVDAAHGYGMRVLMDWVGNHVHEDHPWYVEHADDWFNEQVLCKVGDDYSNFDLLPETCWFAEYLPDIRFYALDPLHVVVEDAITWAQTYELDGFRVDGAKHMPHSVQWNLSARIDETLEHSAAGSAFDFYTIGETYTSSRDWILAYQGESQLDAQFDFPLFFSLIAAMADDSATLADLAASVAASSEAYGEAFMGTFLGNHDVVRWTTYFEEGWVEECAVAEVSDQAATYERLNLAWTFLMTQPGLPLVYYGDELGLPGYADPGNRHPLSWYLDESEPIESVDAMADALIYAQQEQVLRHVHVLLATRKAHLALSFGETVDWWIEDEIWGYARVASADEVLVLLNRSDSDRTLENSLAFAGLSTEGVFEDVLTGETFLATADSISVSLSAGTSRVLVLQ